jgi:hypothetical protein
MRTFFKVHHTNSFYINLYIDMPNRYTSLHTSWMQAKIASFLTDSGLVPVLTTMPGQTGRLDVGGL